MSLSGDRPIEIVEGEIAPPSAREAPDEVPAESAGDETAEQRVELTVTVARDGMEAFLSLGAEPPQPYPFTIEAIEAALAEHGVVQGVLSEEIQHVVASQGLFSGLVIARGKPPEEGEDARIEYLFDQAPKLYGNETDSRIDWRETNLIQRVEEYRPLARKIPARAGSPGTTVTGKKVEPKRVRDVRLPVGRGTKVSEFDDNELQAAIAGSVRVDDARIVVDPVLQVSRDVDFSVGNIDFPGAVKIAGNVLPGFHVRATGDIHVGGYVEAACVECSGTVWVSQGVFGPADDVSIRAGKDVAVKFARNALISAGRNIAVQLEAIACHLECNGTISVGSPAQKKGRIAGGHIAAITAVHTVDLGTEGETETVVVVGPKASEMAETRTRIAKLRKDHTAIVAELANLTMRKIAAGAVWTPPQEQILARFTAAAGQIEEELATLEEQLTSPAKVTPKVLVQGALFPGVRVVMGEVSRSFFEKLERVQLMPTDDAATIVTLTL